MALTKKEKTAIYDGMLKKLEKAELALFASYKGLPSEEVFDAKKKIKGQKAALQVVKNSLLKKAFGDLSLPPQDSSFWKGETAMLVSGNGDYLSPLKVFAEWSKKNEKIKIKGAVLTSTKKWLTEKDVKALAALPGLTELRGQLVGVLASPMTALAGTLNALMIQFLLTLKAIQAQQEKK